MTLKPEHAKIAGYFDFDNGSGHIRGIYAQNNAAINSGFEEWLKPFHANMDVFDHLIIEDLMQASVVMAAFVYPRPHGKRDRPASPGRTRGLSRFAVGGGRR